MDTDCSYCINISTILCCKTWNFPIGWPNCFLVLQYSTVVSAAPWAQKLIVSARTSGDQSDKEGISLFIVDKSTDGVSTRDYKTVDGSMASEVSFENVKLNSSSLIGEEGNAYALIELVADETIAALCASDALLKKPPHVTTVWM